MGKITTRAELVEGLKDQLKLGKMARDAYKEESLIFSNPKILQLIRSMKEDEEKHIGLVEELLDMLENAHK
ncbi:MAG: hypothetical protein ABIB71_07425 [Candidatus Woesearchaeota archaeon]